MVLCSRYLRIQVSILVYKLCRRFKKASLKCRRALRIVASVAVEVQRPAEKSTERHKSSSRLFSFLRSISVLLC